MSLANPLSQFLHIHFKKQDEWDGLLGLGMMSTQKLESVRPKIPRKNNVIA